MRVEYPDHERYRALYLKYYEGRDIGELLSLLEPIADMRVLDLCGGDGRLVLEAITQGAKKGVLVDAQADMISPAALAHSKVEVRALPVRDALLEMKAHGERYDRVVCRQAVNYWFNEETGSLLADVLAPGGRFAFNTFNQRPSEKPRVKEYAYAEHSFVEVAWMIGDVVYHIQVREGLPSHQTFFRWVPPEEFHRLLEPNFVVNEQQRGTTSLYSCERKT